MLLATYCLFAFLAALMGGGLPNLFRLTHTRLQIAVSFVAGLMLGLSLLGLLPHASHELYSMHRGTAWALGGFLVMFLLQRFLPFHHHDVPEGSPLDVDGRADSLAQRSASSLNWIGVALGLSLHSIFDGLALAAAVASGARGHGGALGLGTALAVILHKPFGALAITTLMAASGSTRASRCLVSLAFALVTPLGALLFYLGVGAWAYTHPAWLGCALGFCAGTFLCIACADLLPELQFHSHDRLGLSLALLLGLGTALLIVQLGHREEVSHRLGSTSMLSPADGDIAKSSILAAGWDPVQPDCEPVTFHHDVEGVPLADGPIRPAAGGHPSSDCGRQGRIGPVAPDLA
jgi:zinc and cadmium transporter